MAEEPVLLYETREYGRIVVMTMNRPERMNALGGGLREAVYAGFERFARDEDAWVLVLTGAGDRAFCVGNDLKETADIRRGLANGPAAIRLPYPLNETMDLWKPMRKPEGDPLPGVVHGAPGGAELRSGAGAEPGGGGGLDRRAGRLRGEAEAGVQGPVNTTWFHNLYELGDGEITGGMHSLRA